MIVAIRVFNATSAVANAVMIKSDGTGPAGLVTGAQRIVCGNHAAAINCRTGSESVAIVATR